MNKRIRFELDQGLALLLGCAFLGTGVAKVSSTRFVIETFGAWSVPDGLIVAIGLLEIVAAVLVIIPTTRFVGGTLVTLIMLGASYFHLVRGEPLMMLLPITLLVAAVGLVLLERQGVAQFATQRVSRR